MGGCICGLCCQSVRVCLRLYCACKFQFASVLVRVAVQKMDTFMAHCAHVFECTESTLACQGVKDT